MEVMSAAASYSNKHKHDISCVAEVNYSLHYTTFSGKGKVRVVKVRVGIL